MSNVSTIRDSVGDALSAVLAGESEMITRWVVLVEVMDTHGKRAAYTLVPKGAQSWDTLGLLTYAVQGEQARELVDQLTDDDDDE